MSDLTCFTLICLNKQKLIHRRTVPYTHYTS
uniref:Uncharacterized protein n=1 Tax=Anguilla anguilla TaxID=7936 RepID=A0A0E9WEE4_ANGAN